MRLLPCLALFATQFATQPATAQTATPTTVETPVLARMIEPGETLQASDFELRRMAPNAVRGALQPAQATGKEATHRLMAGTTVRPGDVAVPQIVRRGEALVVSVRAGPLSITSTARALSGGGMGDPVRVVSLDTNRTLTAIVEGRGRVRVVGIWE
ncbi:flagellar basal body P-ring formation chaperone FlgA [Sphingomonas qilianensis]|uniref:Flagella basal body P-ring formation protein FlgA n=1 Tax=Sphingomonas qilianensis TaxID=1736690 RepID=A0ABU9XQP5_9SPHN